MAGPGSINKQLGLCFGIWSIWCNGCAKFQRWPIERAQKSPPFIPSNRQVHQYYNWSGRDGTRNCNVRNFSVVRTFSRFVSRVGQNYLVLSSFNVAIHGATALTSKNDNLTFQTIKKQLGFSKSSQWINTKKMHINSFTAYQWCFLNTKGLHGKSVGSHAGISFSVSIS